MSYSTAAVRSGQGQSPRERLSSLAVVVGEIGAWSLSVSLLVDCRRLFWNALWGEERHYEGKNVTALKTRSGIFY